MERRTIRRLDAINREFYQRHAEAFDATRRRPWDGWKRVVDHLSALERPSILDVGCGNARFGLFAERRLGRPVDYLGIDRSRPLLERARRRGRSAWRWLEADLVRHGLPAALGRRRFDLVACFGVMHHLPGEALRRELLTAMSRHVGAAGLLAVSFWQFGDHARFTGRAVEPRSLDEDSLDLDDEMEPGDYLLPWGESADGATSASLRYCHHSDRAEVERLLAGSMSGEGFEPVDAFVADGASGALNLYRLLRRVGG
ncbi:MAG: class I SAM-dependent methyltransferase [Thermoanaerobaculia bacterium]|nr:class I SAM-dependent methyltransferase [Thermoanaerobaculia bacterium]